MEVFETMMWLRRLKFHHPTRFVAIYKSPLTSVQLLNDSDSVRRYVWVFEMLLSISQIRHSSDLEQRLLQDIPKETGFSGQACTERGVFVRPLEEEAFEKHGECSEWY